MVGLRAQKNLAAREDDEVLLALKPAIEPGLSSKELERGSSEPYGNGPCGNVAYGNASCERACSKAHSKELARSRQEQARSKGLGRRSKEREQHKELGHRSKEQERHKEQERRSKVLGLARSKRGQRHSK